MKNHWICISQIQKKNSNTLYDMDLKYISSQNRKLLKISNKKSA